MRKNLFIILIFGLLFSGCSANWHITKAKQKCPECFKQDTIINSVVFKLDTIIKIDTIILIDLPKDTVTIDTTIKKLKPYSFKPISSKNGIISVRVSMNRGVLHVASFLDSTMIYRYRDSILIKDAIISDLKETVINQGVIIKEKITLIERLKKNKEVIIYILISVLILFITGIIIKFVKWIRK